MSTSLEGRRITALACFDSFGKVGMTMLAACRRAGAETRMVLLDVQGRTLSRRQRVEIQRIDTKTKVTRHPWTSRIKLGKELFDNSDAVILALDGKRSRDTLLLLQALWTNQKRRPLLVSAYPGILFRHQLEGMMDRAGVDLLCLNSPIDFETYSKGCHALNMDSTNAAVTGLPILWDLHPRTLTEKQGTLLFFEQPSVPSNPLQRHYLCRQLEHLAKQWRENLVIFKPRISSLERTLHRHHGEMATRIRKLSKTTPNLKISHKPASHLLRQCSCAITVSSTAALEAMAMGISTRIVADLGLNETLGNHYFSDSGAVADFESICTDPFTVRHHPEWLERHGWQPDGKKQFLAALAARLTSYADASPALSTSGWGSPQWQTFALAHGGASMLTSGGARSAHQKRHRSRSVLRQLRDHIVGMSWLENILRGR